MDIGSIILYSGSVVPEGFLVCDGSAVSRSDYSDLFDVIGVTYGAGDGSMTFNLPNLSGKVALGTSQNYAEGRTGGEESHSLTSTEIAEHAHEVPSHTHANTITVTTPKLVHTVGQAVFTYELLSGSQNGGGSQSTTRAFYNRVTSAAMSRSTDLSISAHGAAACTMSGSITDCNAFNTETTGSGNAHNNMMPYLALTYLIRYAPDEPPKPRMLIYNGCMPVTSQGYYLVGRKS